MRTIRLASGDKVKVDDKDFKKVSKWAWCILRSKNHSIKYARRIFAGGKHVLMHRYLLGLHDRKIWTDHKNGNGLDNRRCNIRVCDSSQNQQNVRINRSNNISGFKGVSWDKLHKQWKGKIKRGKVDLFLGYFRSKVACAKAYDRQARKLFGRFARTNF